MRDILKLCLFRQSLLRVHKLFPVFSKLGASHCETLTARADRQYVSLPQVRFLNNTFTAKYCFIIIIQPNKIPGQPHKKKTESNYE